MRKILSFSRKISFRDDREFKFWADNANFQSKCTKFDWDTKSEQCSLRIISEFECYSRWEWYKNMRRWKKKKNDENDDDDDDEELKYIFEEEIDFRVWNLQNEVKKEKKEEKNDENESEKNEIVE